MKAPQSVRVHPYLNRPPEAFWNRVADGIAPADIAGWYTPKFPIRGRKIATAGSCFAQHIGRSLRARGYPYLDLEPPPYLLDPNNHTAFGFSMYSARYGNVYSSRQLVQLLRRANGSFTPKEAAWERGGGVVDPFRPTIEPQPFGSVAEMERDRRIHLQAVRDLFHRADLFIFTLGLTETWTAAEDGAAFPVAPGVAGGQYDAARHRLLNLSYADVVADLEAFIQEARALKPSLGIIFTVSPVPLAATATDQQVIVATSYSKSVLRAAAGDLAARHPFVDYFPSYEIVSSSVMRGAYFEADGRTVRPEGVEHVMKVFFAAHPAPEGAAKPIDPIAEARRALQAACDEELLLKRGQGF